MRDCELSTLGNKVFRRISALTLRYANSRDTPKAYRSTVIDNSDLTDDAGSAKQNTDASAHAPPIGQCICK